MDQNPPPCDGRQPQPKCLAAPPLEKPSRSRSKPTNPHPQSTKKLEKMDQNPLLAMAVGLNQSASQHRYLLTMAAGFKLNQKCIKTHRILGDGSVGELRLCCRWWTHPATRLARPRSHRRWWQSVEARGRKMDEMRESESCVVRLREREVRVK